MQDNDITLNWPGVPNAALRTTVVCIQAAAFWTAVLMPFAYVPLLATGLSTAGEGLLLLQLLTLNAVALIVGHDHAAAVPVEAD